ncbi:MAG: hypothetical protein NAOJABEB_02469 [Steroidobacteraceae bacterium]|nr:hypothetical protein [Steroidobacteraceae bacterium]
MRPPRPGSRGSRTVDSPPYTTTSAARVASSVAKAVPSASASPAKRRAPTRTLDPAARAATCTARTASSMLAMTRRRRTSWPPGAGAARPEPITAGSSPGTSDRNSASPARPCNCATQPPPFNCESARRAALMVAMSAPSASQPRVCAARSASVTPSRRTSTRLDAPPETSSSGHSPGASERVSAKSCAPAARLRSSGTGCADSTTVTRASSRSAASTCPAFVTTNARAMRGPRASNAPSAMRAAALPTANTTTLRAPAGGSPASAARTHRRPSTACRAAA